MKGKILSKEEILNLKEGDKVWLFTKNCLPIFNHDEIVTIKYSKSYKTLCVYGLYGCICSLIDIPYSARVYEWIEDTDEQTITEKTNKPKIYKGSEILAMIEDRKLFREDILLVANSEDELEVATIIDGNYNCKALLKNNFIIKEKPLDFMTAINSGRNIRIEHEYIPNKEYMTVENLLDLIINTYGIGNADIIKLLNEGKFYIEN